MRLFRGKRSRQLQREQRQNKAAWSSFNRNLATWDLSSSDDRTKNPVDKKRQSIVRVDQLPSVSNNDEREFAFRRNATMSNWRRESREKFERQKIHATRLRHRQIKIIAVVLLTISALVVTIISQFSGSFTAVSSGVSLTGAEASRYSSLVTQYLAQHPFERFSFSRRNAALAQFIQAQAPEVANVSLNPFGLGGGRLNLSFRHPVAMWTSAGVTSFVDSNGIVFVRNYFDNPSVAITDDSGTAVASGGQTTSSGFLSFIGQIEAKLAKNGQTLQRVVIPRGAIRYADIYLQGRSYPFLVRIDRETSSQVSDILASVDYIDTNKITPQYVDVRVASKMYWK